MSTKAVLIAGPTASGKSALALELARTHGGVVINTDSMQVYRDLRVITARPTPEEEAQVPHRLYGHVDAAVNCSAGMWVSDAERVLTDARAEARLPIFVGGSGLYFKALTRGLSAVPAIPPEVREAVRARLERDGPEALHEELRQSDPVAAELMQVELDYIDSYVNWFKARGATTMAVVGGFGRRLNPLLVERYGAFIVDPRAEPLHGALILARQHFADA